MNFENIFLLWLKLSILISKALLKVMAAGEGFDLADFTGLCSEGEGSRERTAGAARKTKKEEGLKNHGKAKSSFHNHLLESQGRRRPINPRFSPLSLPFL